MFELLFCEIDKTRDNFHFVGIAHHKTHGQCARLALTVGMVDEKVIKVGQRGFGPFAGSGVDEIYRFSSHNKRLLNYYRSNSAAMGVYSGS